jgi:hypothetical protein
VTLPPTLARAEVERDLVAAAAWARRHGWALRGDPDALELRASTYHPASKRLLEIRATLDEYPALPPAWRFVLPGTDESPPAAWPLAGQLAGVSGSIFHPNPCICAPWNRLAYTAHGGPHSEWVMASWRAIGGGSTKADHLADMLDQLHMHLSASPGFHA